MICQKCGANGPDGSLFCHACGSRQQVVEETPHGNTVTEAQAFQPVQHQPDAQAFQPVQRQPDAQAFQPMQRQSDAQAFQPVQRQSDAQAFQPVQRQPDAQAFQPAQRQPDAQAFQPMQRQSDAQAFQPVHTVAAAQSTHMEQSAPISQPHTAAGTAVQPASNSPMYPSLYALKCPKCGGDTLQVLGEKGSTAKSIGTSFAFGAIGNIAASSRAAKKFETQPLKYKCDACNEKFVTPPLMAQPDELLPTPCNISFQRMSNFVGAAINNIVYLNGVKVGPVKNGKLLEFPTYIRYNTIFVTDPHGVAFKSMFKFEAQPGGFIQVRFNRKFV